MHYEVLSLEHRDLLPKLAFLKNRFYLGGGTALALHIGHRDSIDFDFFSETSFNPVEMAEELRGKLDGGLVVTQQEKDTLTVTVSNSIKISLFAYPYPLIEDLIDTENLCLASVMDIGCMKLSAIVGRATWKDYVDLYFILQQISLNTLLESIVRKYPTLDQIIVLKGLVYFEDVKPEPLLFKVVNPPTPEQVQQFLTDKTKEYLG